jgi:hypothetical protein
MQRANILNNKLPRIAMLAIFMLLNVEADHIVAFGKQAVRPPAKTAIEINRERLRHAASSSSTAASR